MTTHPCLRCGACCAAFRVAFHWSQAQPDDPHGPPADVVVPLRRHEVAMRGSDVAPHRCIALVGTIGVGAHCGIYTNRPPPCRELQPAWEHGEPSPQCDRARAVHGLPPLTPDDWR